MHRTPPPGDYETQTLVRRSPVESYGSPEFACSANWLEDLVRAVLHMCLTVRVLYAHSMQALTYTYTLHMRPPAVHTVTPVARQYCGRNIYIGGHFLSVREGETARKGAGTSCTDHNY